MRRIPLSLFFLLSWLVSQAQVSSVTTSAGRTLVLPADNISVVWKSSPYQNIITILDGVRYQATNPFDSLKSDYGASVIQFTDRRKPSVTFLIPGTNILYIENDQGKATVITKYPSPVRYLTNESYISTIAAFAGALGADQVLSFDTGTNQLTISAGNTVDLSTLNDSLYRTGDSLWLFGQSTPVNISDLGDQTLSFNSLNDTLSLTGGGDVSLASLSDSIYRSGDRIFNIGQSTFVDLSDFRTTDLSFKVYAPAHGATLGQPWYLSKADNAWRLADASFDSTLCYAVVVGLPDVDTLSLQSIGLATIPGHGKEIGYDYALHTVTGQYIRYDSVVTGFAQWVFTVIDANTWDLKLSSLTQDLTPPLDQFPDTLYISETVNGQGNSLTFDNLSDFAITGANFTVNGTGTNTLATTGNSNISGDTLTITGTTQLRLQPPGYASAVLNAPFWITGSNGETGFAPYGLPPSAPAGGGYLPISTSATTAVWADTTALFNSKNGLISALPLGDVSITAAAGTDLFLRNMSTINFVAPQGGDSTTWQLANSILDARVLGDIEFTAPNAGNDIHLYPNGALTLGLITTDSIYVYSKYSLPNAFPSATLNDTTFMAWRGNGVNGVPIGFLNKNTFGDNLGNHSMAQNLATNGRWISDDGSSEGLFIYAHTPDRVGINVSSVPTETLLVRQAGTPNANTGIVQSNSTDARNNFFAYNEQSAAPGNQAIIGFGTKAPNIAMVSRIISEAIDTLTNVQTTALKFQTQSQSGWVPATRMTLRGDQLFIREADSIGVHSSLVVEGKTNDGSTDIIRGQDSGAVEMFSVNTDGNGYLASELRVGTNTSSLASTIFSKATSADGSTDGLRVLDSGDVEVARIDSDGGIFTQGQASLANGNFTVNTSGLTQLASHLYLPDVGRIRFDAGAGAYITEESNGIAFFVGSTGAVKCLDLGGTGNVDVGTNANITTILSNSSGVILNGSTNDGSTPIISGTDSGDVEVFKVNTDGVVTVEGSFGVSVVGTDRALGDDTAGSYTAADRGAIVQISDQTNNSTIITYTLAASPTDKTVITCECKTGSVIDADDGCRIAGNGINIQGLTNYDFPAANTTVTIRYSSVLGEWKIIQ